MVLIVGGRISCRTDPALYEKERSGAKRNTVRMIKDIHRDGYTSQDISKCDLIKIINTETGEHFSREISDISIWHGIVIISWQGVII